jgi:peptide/nickel transport system ATP-binding protein
MSVAVAVDNVSKRFGRSLSLGERIALKLGGTVDTRAVIAVDGVSLEIGRGEVVGLVGESGCGKSTLGRMVAGIHVPSGGRVTVEGEPVMAGTPARKRTTQVQMVFQDPFASLDPRMRVGDTIAEGPIHHGLVARSSSRAYVAEWLAAVGLDASVATRYPHQFSGGQRQRIAIARALAMKPEVLVCDEPVASLDVSIQAQIINLFADLQQRLSLTYVFIAHDLSVVRQVSTRVAVMYLGSIVELAPAEALFLAPAHPYTAALISAVPLARRSGVDRPRRIVLQGDVPNPTDPPSGCRFHPRCSHAQARCREERPPLRAVAPGRQVACHFPLEGRS